MPTCPDRQEYREYGPVRLLNIRAEAPAAWETGAATHVRVCLPAAHEHLRAMSALGYTFGDRLLDVEILPARTRIDYGRLARLKPELTAGDKREILAIAREGFAVDRRFHVAPDYDPEAAAAVLAGWVEELEETWVCRVRGETAGFLALKKAGEKAEVIHLAAVAEKYRAAGVGLSLYAGAIDEVRRSGVEAVRGTISAANVAVLNLYAYLGGTFSNPHDVFLKKVEA